MNDMIQIIPVYLRRISAIVDISPFIDLIEKIGLAGAIVIALIVAAFFYLYRQNNKLYKDVIEGKSEEIERLVADNKHLREILTNFLTEERTLKLPPLSGQVANKKEKTIIPKKQ